MKRIICIGALLLMAANLNAADLWFRENTIATRKRIGRFTDQKLVELHRALDRAQADVIGQIAAFAERHGMEEEWTERATIKARKELFGGLGRAKGEIKSEIKQRSITYRFTRFAAEAEKKHIEWMKAAFKSEYYGQASQIETALPDPAVKAVLGGARLPIPQAQAMLDFPFAGFPVSERWQKIFTKNGLKKLQSSLTTSMINGEGMAATNRRIRRVFRTIKRKDLDTLVRTEMMRAANAGADAAMEQFKPALEGVICDETLDSRTCAICGPYDGTIYYFNPKPGQADYESRPNLPRHPNCRGRYSPKTKSLEKIGDELGVDFSGMEWPERMRASKRGPARQNWTGWFGDQSAAVQTDILGPTRYKLWKAGEYRLEDFSTPAGYLRPVRDLKKIAD